MMKIYFCGSIAGGRAYLDAYKKIVAHLKVLGHSVLTDHIVLDNVLDFEYQFTAEDIYRRDVAMLKDCDTVIAEISNPSLGVGYEICYAEHLKKPLLCLFKQGLSISKMITGNKAPTITCDTYLDEVDMLRKIDNFLKHRRQKFD
jgi:2'-deoxynucleoside 5'-phosphate N-hydrolase